MTYFDKTRSKLSAIKEGETDLIDIADEQKAEDEKLELMREQGEREDATYLRNLICTGRHIDGPGMMTLEEHKDALDAIDATPEERQEYNYRVLQADHHAAKVRLTAPRPGSMRPSILLGQFY